MKKTLKKCKKLSEEHKKKIGLAHKGRKKFWKRMDEPDVGCSDWTQDFATTEEAYKWIMGDESKQKGK